MRTAVKRLAVLTAALMLLCACTPSSPAVNEPQQTDPAADAPSSIHEAEAPAQDTSEAEPNETQIHTDLPQSEPEEEYTLRLTINDTEVSVLWEDNESVDALIELVREGPVSIPMSPYGGFEQVGPIGQSLPRDDAQITTQPGDLVLYSGDQIVAFYGSNTWAYTRLGRIQEMNAEALTALLGGDAVTLTLSAGSDHTAGNNGIFD